MYITTFLIKKIELAINGRGEFLHGQGNRRALKGLFQRDTVVACHHCMLSSGDEHCCDRSAIQGKCVRGAAGPARIWGIIL